MERKYKINATKQQLEEIGISYDLTGLEGIFKYEYGDGFIMLAVTHSPSEGVQFTNDFDLHKSMLDEILDTPEVPSPFAGQPATIEMLKAKAQGMLAAADILGKRETHWEKEYYTMLKELAQDIKRL